MHVEHENAHAYHVLNFFYVYCMGMRLMLLSACSAVAYNFQAYAHMQCALKINMCMLCISKKKSDIF